MKQENQGTTILIIDNVIYAPECRIRLISPKQLHRQSKAKEHEHSCFTTDENTATLFHRGDKYTCDYHPKTKIPTISCITHITLKTSPITATTFAEQPSFKGPK
jgi:hypothetical protein